MTKPEREIEKLLQMVGGLAPENKGNGAALIRNLIIQSAIMEAAYVIEGLAGKTLPEQAAFVDVCRKRVNDGACCYLEAR